jgi:hypothetical protein
VRVYKQMRVMLCLIACAGINATTDAGAQMATKSAEPACQMQAADKAWLDRTVAAWRYAAITYGQFTVPANARAIIGSAECVFISDTALFPGKQVVWVAVDGKGKIPIIEDFAMPLSPVSQAIEVNGNPYFVMSAPSVWQKAKISGGRIGLENLMTAVFIHETSHVLQQKNYYRAMSLVAEKNGLPADFNDDSIQDRFKAHKAFAGAMKREIDLLFVAAKAPDTAKARKLARQILTLMKARRKEYFTGKDAYLTEVEDIFLTLEGSGQWLGYQWLIDPQGGRQTEADALARFSKDADFWSQNQGLAMFLVVNRLDGGAWKKTAFGIGGKTGIAFLETALAHRRIQN